MSDTITIKLTRAVKAAAKRLERLRKWQMSPRWSPHPYDFKEVEPQEDERELADAVLAAIKKGGAG